MRFPNLHAVCILSLLANANGAPEFFHTNGAWAMLVDGRVTSWGTPNAGGDSSLVKGITSGVKTVAATKSAFTALKADGSVISWGKPLEGGISPDLRGVVKLVASADTFAALQADGGVVFWGLHGTVDESDGSDGNGNFDTKREELEDGIFDSGMVDVVASSSGFACIKEDGTIYSWNGSLLKKVYEPLNSPVAQVVGGLSSFAALKEDGSVFTWGHSDFGGDSTSVREHLQSGVLSLERRSIFDRGFIAWKANSTAVIWGHNTKGIPLKSQITRARQVQVRHSAGAVLQPDGKAFAFGDPKTFGDSNGVDLENVKSILCPRFACAAVNHDGSVVTWGQQLGEVPKLQNVDEVFGTPFAFAALVRNPPGQSDDIVTWGHKESGGHIDFPTKSPSYFKVRTIHSHIEGSKNGVFLAEMVEDSNGLHGWGDPRYGGWISQTIERRLQTGGSLCLDDGIAADNRKELENSDGERYPLGIPQHDDYMSSVLVKIVIEEALGYHVTLQTGITGQMSGIAALAGCTNYNDYATDKTGCAGGTTRSHVAVSVPLLPGSGSGGSAQWSEINAINSAYAPVRLEPMFKSREGMFISTSTWQQKTQPPLLGTKEGLNESDAYIHFDMLTSFNISVLQVCSNVPEWQNVNLLQIYVSITNDVSGVNASGSAACHAGYWWLAPGPCREGFGFQCVPLIAGIGGQVQQFMQKAAMWHMALAIAVAIDWDSFLHIPRTYRCLFYWYEPSNYFVDLEPKWIRFPLFNRTEWEAGNLTNNQQREGITNMVSYDLQSLAPRVDGFIRNFNITRTQVRSIMVLNQNLRDEYQAACTWLRNNLDVWKPFVPAESNVTLTTTTVSTTMTTVSVTTATVTTATVTTTTVTTTTVPTTTVTTTTVTTTTVTTVTATTVTMTSSTLTTFTTSSTLVENIVLPSDLKATEPEGSAVLASLQGALEALRSNQDSVVLATDAGNVTVVKINTATATGSSLVFEFNEGGGQATNGAIAVSVPVSLVRQLEAGANVMLAVNQVSQVVMEELGETGGEGKQILLSAPVIEISLVEETLGEVAAANVSGLTEPILFRLQDTALIEDDQCAFFDTATKSWLTEGISLATSSQIADLGVQTGGTWCATTHLSLFSAVATIPFDKVINVKDSLVSQETFVLGVILMLVVFVPVCVIFCTWAFFRVQAPTGGKTTIQGHKGKSMVVKFTRSHVSAKTDEVAKEKTWKSSRSEKEKTKVLVTWDVQPEEVMPKLDDMKGHGWVAVDVHSGPRVTEKKSLKDLRSVSRDNVLEELRRASQEDDRLEEENRVTRAEAGDEDDEAVDMIEASLGAEGNVCEMYEDHGPVNYWSSTHQTLMQGFISGKGQWNDNNELCYDVLVGSKKQRREQVPCQVLSPAFRDGETVFYDEGTKTRKWRKAVVTQCIHSKAILQVMDIMDTTGDLEQTDAASFSDEPEKKDVPFERVCRRFVKDTMVLVYQGASEGWQPAMTEEVEEFSDEFSPLEVTTIKVRLHGEGDPVSVQTCFIQNMKDETIWV